MGADITWVQHDEFYGAQYVDSDGVTKDMLTLLKNHGFNSIRLRTFVDPLAADGYDQSTGFGDLAHTVTMAQRVHQAGLGFLLDLHYSDNWADPGKQCIPVAWQHDTSADAGSPDGGPAPTTLPQLAQHVYDYTFNVLTTLKNAGALPELVQIGNEITPGMLINICDSNGIPLAGAAGVSPVNGRATNWANLGTLLKAGIQAVRAVDPTIKTVLHIDKGGDVNASIAWIRNAQGQGVPFDVFADTCYVRYQGQPSGWQNTFTMLAATFPTLSFIIPEYGNETATSPATPSTMRLANDIMFNLPGNRGLGAWIYEPEHPAQAAVGIGLFMSTVDDAGVRSDSWPVFTAIPSAMSVYDGMKVAYASRL
jgi:arabinogalactan endo-1,4-beta-galactosidase